VARDKKPIELRNAIDQIESSLMGFGDFLEVEELFDGARGDLAVKVTCTVAQLQRVRNALAECTRIINSPEYDVYVTPRVSSNQ
jgi:Cu/Ag efflux pump CusA